MYRQPPVPLFIGDRVLWVLFPPPPVLICAHCLQTANRVPAHLPRPR